MIILLRLKWTVFVLAACLVGCSQPTVEVPVDSELGKAMKADNDNQMKGAATRTKGKKAVDPEE